MWTQDPDRIRAAGLLSAIAGAVLVPYALTKGTLTTRVVAEGWQIGPLGARSIALLVHMAETAPLLLIAVGLLALYTHLGGKWWLGLAGLVVALAGIGATIAVHLGEHLLAPLTVPALFGGMDLLVWSYYLGWLVIYSGCALLGLAILRGRADHTALGAYLLVLPVAVVLLGLTLVVSNLFTLAGTFRLVLGVTWVGLGVWLWAGGSAVSATRTDDVGMRRGSEDG